MKKRILITGSSGMLGAALCNVCSENYEIYGVDTISPCIKNAIEFAILDITDEAGTIEFIGHIKPDFIIHAAAYTDVDGCEGSEEKAYAINSSGAQNVASAAKEIGAFLFCISTDFVFDGKKNTPYTEQDEPHPINIYGQSKLEGEKAIAEVLDKYAIIRTSWLFGKGGRNFVDAILAQAGKKKELKVVKDQAGSPTYTGDFAKAITELMRYTEKGPSERLYHVTNSGSVSWYEYAAEILDLAGLKNVKLSPITSSELNRPAMRPKMSILDNSRYQKLTGDTLRSYKEALKEYISERRKG